MTSKLVMVLFLLAVPVQALADHHEGGQTAAAEEKVQAPVEVGNKLCPVSGEKVGTMGDVVKYEYNGKVYNLCCAGCIPKFQDEGEKYSKIAEDEVAEASAGSGS